MQRDSQGKTPVASMINFLEKRNEHLSVCSFTHCRVALERGLIQSQGKTPEATMASALYTDVKRKAEKSVFTRCVAVSCVLGGTVQQKAREPVRACLL